MVYDYEIKLPEEKWVDRPPKEFLYELELVKESNFNLDKENWLGLLFQMIRQISKNDFLKIKGYILERTRRIDT